MDQRSNYATTRSLLGSDVLYGLSTVRNELEPLHRRPDIMLNKQGLPHSLGRRRLKKLVHESNIRFCTWNIRTLNEKSIEVVGVMKDRRINILCLQETKWTGEVATELEGYKPIGKVSARNGVGIVVDGT
ncbi:uncharacterized protein LOC114743922 [Neltuma alba]|uniref:uncharacterized protein LOC114743922 n=1 Tax=Neltuma alba TaxID=207710 RepID=UPI0010A56493|nr:uncharacterized protein LOC114743922 [Prosopis alba]